VGGAVEAIEHFPPLTGTDGPNVAAMGIQGSDGARARRAVRELRILVARGSEH
jgi:hypothetical protein